MTGKWITPFKKQCFVVLGASINMSQLGMVMGFAAVLVPQLKAEDSIIPIDDSSGSWIAALPGFALMIGNLITPTLMAKFGRKIANIIGIVIVITGWNLLAAATDIKWILTARLFQGLSVGMSSCLTPIIIGEYTSPKNRGAFSILMSLIMATGTLIVHGVGSYVKWKTSALVIAIISTVDLIIVAFSPETPTWLADQGRYEESKKAFQWLRGDEEMEELDRLIQTSIITKESIVRNRSLSRKFKEYVSIVKKKEFYKPIIIMMHLYTMSQWAGINILAPYIGSMVEHTVGKNMDVALIVVSVDIQRVISSLLAVFIVRKVKRRTMLFTTCALNVIVYLVTAGYIYAKTKLNMAGHPVIGIFLIHALMMTVAIGSLPLPLTIAGEIFILKYRSLSSGISALVSSINIFISIKTFSYFVSTLGVDGAYCLYAFIMIYCLSVVWFLLPETKDKTLHDIENELKGKLEDDDLKAAQPLTIIKNVDIKE